MEQNSASNPLAGLNKQKLYCLIFAGVGLISLLLPWRTWGGLTIKNGLSGMGLIALLGVIGVIVATFFMGDKSKPYEGQTKQIALGSFAAIAAGAVLTLVTKLSVGGYSAKTNAGLGVWLAIAAGALGILFLLGIVKVPKSIDDKMK
jgi:hypothetical protein